MILKGFKEKSNKNYIISELKSRIVKSNSNKIKTVGIIINAEEEINVDWFNAFKDALKLSENNFKIIALKSQIKKGETYSNPTYALKDIGWKGTINNKELKAFLYTDLDLLISYYTKETTALKLLTVASKAKFKVGVLQTDERINDLIIKTQLQEFNLFKTELIKYLNILNKL